MPRWGKGYEGCGESWALPAASWGWQDLWGIGGALQLWRGREMCALPRSASSARAPAGFISSRWVPQMDQFKSGSTKSSRVHAHGAVAVTHGWPALGEMWMETQALLAGRRHLLVASWVPPRNHSHISSGCDSDNRG